MLNSANVYRIQHITEDPDRRNLGTGYTTWCLLSTNVVEILDFRRRKHAESTDMSPGAARHMSIAFFPPGAEAALRAGAAPGTATPQNTTLGQPTE